ETWSRGESCPVPSRSRRLRRRAWMISSITMTPMLKRTTMMTDSQSPIGLPPSARRGGGRDHGGTPLLRPHGLLHDERRAEVGDEHGHQGLRRDEAHEHPDRQEAAHD